MARVTFISLASIQTSYTYGYKREVKKAEYRQRSLFAFLWIEMPNSRSKISQLKERSQYICVIDQACCRDGWILVKFFFCVFMD